MNKNEIELESLTYNDVISANLLEYNGEFGDNYHATHDCSMDSHYSNIDYSREINIDYLKKCNNNFDTIIELGPGSGKLTIDLINQFPKNKFIFTDLSENMLNQLEHRIETLNPNINAEYIVGPSEEILTNIDEPIFLLCMAGVLHHFYDYKDIIQKIKNLRPKYIYFALEPIKPQEISTLAKILHAFAGQNALIQLIILLPEQSIIRKTLRSFKNLIVKKKTTEENKETLVHNISESGGLKMKLPTAELVGYLNV